MNTSIYQAILVISDWGAWIYASDSSLLLAVVATEIFKILYEFANVCGAVKINSK